MSDQNKGKQAVEELAKNQQVGLMHGAQMQFLSCVTCTPPPSGMPFEVRRHMYQALTKTRQLFAPQGEEDYDAPNSPDGE
jgi:hypothetical protein